MKKIIPSNLSDKKNDAIKMVLYLFFLTSSMYANGQFVATTSDTVIATGTSSQFEIISYSGIRNTSQSTLNLKWKRILNNSPSGWENTICDFNACFPPNVDSSTLTLNPGNTTNLDGHFRPNNFSGTGTQRIMISDINDPTNYKIITLIATTNSSGTINNPNFSPTEWILEGDAIHGRLDSDNLPCRLLIFDLNGRSIRNFWVEENEVEIKLENLTRGIYILNIDSKNPSFHKLYIR